MRVTKQKRHRKVVRFYTACFGFREPFKVLCDGTFVHHMLVNRIIPADTALTNTLGATVRIFTTSCVLAELKSLGASYSESLNAASNLIIARCDHEMRKSAVGCMIDVIGVNNSEHFFVATQDAELRKKLHEIPGVPVIYGLRNALFLEKPSTYQHQFVKSAEETRSYMTEMEYKMLKLKKKVSSDGEMELFNANESDEAFTLGVLEIEANSLENRERLKDRVRFKRKIAKGPNPLSCLKKKSTGENSQSSAPAKEIQHTDASTRSGIQIGKRKRKRLRKSKRITEPTS